MGALLPVNAQLVRADNQWGRNKTPLIKVSLYIVERKTEMGRQGKCLSNTQKGMRARLCSKKKMSI
ncbi:hypothetical protein E0M27_05815 [Bacillus mycoides]|nr:hypothetical protein E0M27_05815 [Bacillus mycoides]